VFVTCVFLALAVLLFALGYVTARVDQWIVGRPQVTNAQDPTPPEPTETETPPLPRNGIQTSPIIPGEAVINVADLEPPKQEDEGVDIAAPDPGSTPSPPKSEPLTPEVETSEPPERPAEPAVPEVEVEVPEPESPEPVTLPEVEAPMEEPPVEAEIPSSTKPEEPAPVETEQPAEKPAPSPPALDYDPGPQSPYTIQVAAASPGSFGKLKTYQKQIADAYGYAVKLIPSEDGSRVLAVIGEHPNYDSAAKAVEELRQHKEFKDCWIKKLQ
jgi:septal ring-binding cell division protein DamX